ncbi:hypothetical protein BVX95_01135 [archaeon D22]|nr:hypothetical protein BVX95_01135 [archaeon D22]
MIEKKNAQLSENLLTVLSFFTRGYDLKLHGRDLVKKINLSQRAISDILKSLETKGVLKSELRGSIKEYSLRQGYDTFNYVLMAENFKAILLSRDFELRNLFSKIKSDKMLVFGSYARGDNTKTSDLDILIIGDYDKKEIEGIISMYPMEINVMHMTDGEFENAVKDKKNFIMEIYKNHIIVRGLDYFVKKFWEELF